ncbi:MAG: hypothetical protein N4A33_08870 [Bacteriovoracaceae bacterium]|jgi:RPA family protein|nr:hypothetical protein [Bacteriovoracaceae bacterium]
MQENLFSILEEQHFLGFTGKVNLLDEEQGQYIASIFIESGSVVNAKLNKLEGIDAFLRIFEAEFNDQALKYIVEPEMIDTLERKIHFPLATLKRKVKKHIELIKNSQNLKPPMNLKILIDAKEALNFVNFTYKEFDILKLICDYNKVEDIYKNTVLSEDELTSILVRLRRDKIIKVVR